MIAKMRLLSLLLALCACGAQADELRIPVGSQGHIEASTLPPHGMSMGRVRADWGRRAEPPGPAEDNGGP